MVTPEAILDVLRTIDDPEMPVSIVDLGLVQRIDATPATVAIDLLPTFVGCPALPVLEEEVRRKVGTLDGVSRVEVRFVYDPPWSVDRISPAGREALRTFGVTVPGAHDDLVQVSSPLACPFCHSTQTQLESSFGPTRCRMIYYCQACKNSFEHMKRV